MTRHVRGASKGNIFSQRSLVACSPRVRLYFARRCFAPILEATDSLSEGLNWCRQCRNLLYDSFYFGRDVIWAELVSYFLSSKRSGKEPSYSKFIGAGLFYFFEGEQNNQRTQSTRSVERVTNALLSHFLMEGVRIVVISVPDFHLVSYVVGTSDPSIEVISLMKALHVLNSHWTTLYEVSKGRNMNLVNYFFTRLS